MKKFSLCLMLSSILFAEINFENPAAVFGYYEDDTTLIVVDKTAQKINVYESSNGSLDEKFNQNIITGFLGDKQKEGDRKTPVGVYDIQKEIDPPTSYYGPVAFTTSYPNAYDTARKKTGSGIWVHGYPMEGNREDMQHTRGCVAMTNDKLLNLQKIISKKNLVLIINENGVLKSNANEIKDVYFAFFEWVKNRAKLDNIKQINISHLAITPYPQADSSDAKMFRIKFHANRDNLEQESIIYAKLVDKKLKILIESSK